MLLRDVVFTSEICRNHVWNCSVGSGLHDDDLESDLHGKKSNCLDGQVRSHPMLRYCPNSGVCGLGLCDPRSHGVSRFCRCGLSKVDLKPQVYW